MPIVHQPTLRGNITLLSAEVISIRGTLSNRWAGTNPHRTTGVELPALQSFTLLTALCAEAACILPPQLFTKGPAIADHFLEASRNVLKLYHDKNIEQPHSTSLVIHYFHSNCTHAAGKIRLSWYLLGEAIRMAQEMKLHDESSLEGLDSVEAQLRRNVFWQLYTGDKSAALLNNRPFTLHEFNPNTKISLSYTSQQNTSLLDATREHNAEPFESCIMTGFNLCQRLWSLASDLLLNLKMFQPFSLRLLAAPSLPEEQRTALMDAYVQYTSLLDDMPAWLRHPESNAQYPNNSDRKYQKFCFWIQRINLQVSFQCLRLIILQKFVDLGLSSLGISSEPLMVALRKTEIAQDMLNMILETPFESLQVNGEPCVEKIRQIGASLLEITQNIDNPRIAARAHSDFSILLDILARLNWKAADAL